MGMAVTTKSVIDRIALKHGDLEHQGASNSTSNAKFIDDKDLYRIDLMPVCKLLYRIYQERK
jgi:hypothetical protein